MNKEFRETANHVIEWAAEKGLTAPKNYLAQLCKVTEEIGELNAAILKNKRAEETDSFGDILVTLVILADQRGVNIENCFFHAYEEIKNRKGKMLNGSFIKDENL
jgi:NTP pyrophosphatase (non-canonical NTP hydrolase)